MKTELIKSIPPSRLSLPVPGRDHIRGPDEAPMMLLEYGDYECPFCGAAYPVVKAILEKLGNELCFAFRNFPLTNMHPHSEHAAEAAESAGVQGKFWEMHDVLYENQDALEDDDLVHYALGLNLEAHRLIKEVETAGHRARIREDFRSGVRAGVNGTPCFFINGERHDGGYDYNTLLAALTHAAAWHA